ncbi:MAG: hypothetical protein LBU14_04435 [Candidatus Peribacteria bacterium]|jgi:hypothetical protein|nr:hypothetical protein [Candidatus Peribacteria bacterium]
MKKEVALLYNLNRGQNVYETDFDCELTINTLYKTINENYECIEIEVDRNI